MESVLRKTGVHRNGTIFQKNVQLIAYADDIDIIGRTKRDVTAAFSAIEPESTNLGLTVNADKTTYMFSTSGVVRRIDSQIMADIFDTVKEFIYLGSAVSLKIKRRITLANRCCYALNGQLSNKTLILPVLLYGADA